MTSYASQDKFKEYKEKRENPPWRHKPNFGVNQNKNIINNTIKWGVTSLNKFDSPRDLPISNDCAI